MALIDPDGLFGGDRFDLVSDEARLAWPHFWCASNGYARLEINYRRLLGRVFFRFKAPPPEEQVMRWMKEYYEAWLLFVYAAEGSVWGQWWTSEKYLPRYKTAADNTSPAPNAEEMRKWQEAYELHKNSKTANNISLFGKFSEKFPIGVGVGVGVVDGNSSASVNPDAGLFDLEPPERNVTLREKQEQWFNSEFWPVVWRKIDRADALKAFRQLATSEAVKDLIVRRATEYAAVYSTRELDRQPYPSTWLRKRRYEEPVEQQPAQVSSLPTYDQLGKCL